MKPYVPIQFRTGTEGVPQEDQEQPYVPLAERATVPSLAPSHRSVTAAQVPAEKEPSLSFRDMPRPAGSLPEGLLDALLAFGKNLPTEAALGARSLLPAATVGLSELEKLFSGVNVGPRGTYTPRVPLEDRTYMLEEAAREAQADLSAIAQESPHQLGLFESTEPSHVGAWLAKTLGYSVPRMGVAAAGALLTRSPIGGGALSSPMFIGDTASRRAQLGLEPKPIATVPAGVVNAALEMVPLAQLFRPARAIRPLSVAAQEGVTGAAQALVDRAAAEQELLSREAAKEYAESALGEMVVGLGAAAGTKGTKHYLENVQSKRTAELERAILELEEEAKQLSAEAAEPQRGTQPAPDEASVGWLPRTEQSTRETATRPKMPQEPSGETGGTDTITPREIVDPGADSVRTEPVARTPENVVQELKKFVPAAEVRPYGAEIPMKGGRSLKVVIVNSFRPQERARAVLGSIGQDGVIRYAEANGLSVRDAIRELSRERFVISGAYGPLKGADIIRLAKGIRLDSTVPHELTHYIFRNLLSDAERRVVLRRFGAKDLSDPVQVEDAEEAFVRYMSENPAERAPGPVRRAISLVHRLYEGLRSTMGLDPSFGSIERTITHGHIWDRTVRASESEPGARYETTETLREKYLRENPPGPGDVLPEPNSMGREELQGALTRAPFVVISAQTDSSAHNESAHQALWHELRRLGYRPQQTMGAYRDLEGKVTPTEAGWLVPNMRLSDAAALGRTYGQESILYANYPEGTGLLYTNGELRGKAHTLGKEPILGDEARKQEYHTVIDTKDGELAFSFPYEGDLVEFEVPTAIRKVRHRTQHDQLTELQPEEVPARKPIRFTEQESPLPRDLEDMPHEYESEIEREKVYDLSADYLKVAGREDMEGVLRERGYRGVTRSLERPGSPEKAPEILWWERTPAKQRFQLVSLKEIGQFLDSVTPKAADDKRAVDEAVRTIVAVKRRARSGEGWYDEDAERAIDILRDGLGWDSLNDPDHRSFLKSIIAATSSGVGPSTNIESAGDIYGEFLESGDLPLKQKSGAAWPSYGQPALKTLRSLYDKFDRDLGKLNNFLGSRHKIADIQRELGSNQVFGLVGQDKNAEVPGWYVLGPKQGAYASSLHGLEGEETLDRWAIRFMRRIFGDLATSETNIDPASGLRDKVSPNERKLFRRVIRDAAKELGISSAQVQAHLWFYEQHLYTLLGSKRGHPMYLSEAADEYVRAVHGKPRRGFVGLNPYVREEDSPPRPPRGIGKSGVAPEKGAEYQDPHIRESFPGTPEYRQRWSKRVKEEHEALTENKDSWQKALEANDPIRANLNQNSRFQITLFVKRGVKRVYPFDPPDSPSFRRFIKDSVVRNRDGSPKVMFHGTTAEPDFSVFLAGPHDIGPHFGTLAQALFRIHTGSDYAKKYPNYPPRSRVYPVYLNIKRPLLIDDLGTWNTPNVYKNYLEGTYWSPGWPKALMKDYEALCDFWSNYEDERESIRPHSGKTASAHELVKLDTATANALERDFGIDLEEATPFKMPDEPNEGENIIVATNGDMVLYRSPLSASWTFPRLMRALLIVHGYDGVQYINRFEAPGERAASYIAFWPNQIKSAIANSGDFGESSDIRYQVLVDVSGAMKKFGADVGELLYRTIPEGGTVPERVIKQAGKAGEEFLAKVNRVHSETHRYASRWNDIMQQAWRQLSRADKAWARKNFLWAFEDGTQMPNARLERFKKAWTSVNAHIAGKAAKVGIKVWNPNTQSYEDPFQRIPPSRYVPHVLTPDARKALVEKRGPLYDAIVQAAQVRGIPINVLAELVNPVLPTKRHGNLEHHRTADLPRTVQVDGREVKVLDDNLATLSRHILASARRLSMVSEFGNAGTAAYINALTEHMVQEGLDSEVAQEVIPSVIKRLQGIEERDPFLYQPMLKSAWKAFETGVVSAALSAAVIPNLIGGHLPESIRMGTVQAIKEFAHAYTTAINSKSETQVRQLGNLTRDIMDSYAETEALGDKGRQIGRIVMKATGFDLVNKKINQAIAHGMIKTNLRAMLDAIRNKESGFLKRAWGKDETWARRYLQNELGFTEEEVDRMVAFGPTEQDLARAVSTQQELVNAVLESPTRRPAHINSPLWRIFFAFTTYIRKQARTTHYVINEAKHGNVRPLATLLFLGPATGLAIRGLRDELKDREREDERFWESLYSGLMEVGTFGLYSKFEYALNHLGEPNHDFFADTFYPPHARFAREAWNSIMDSFEEKSIKPLWRGLKRVAPAADIVSKQVERATGDRDAILERLEPMSRVVGDKVLPRKGKERNFQRLYNRWLENGGNEKSLVLAIKSRRLESNRRRAN